MSAKEPIKSVRQNDGINIILTFIILTLVSLATASAQYAIDWRTMNGGGGTSTGGVYSVIGTNWVLQETLSLSPTNWMNSASGSTNPIAVPASLPTTFYRLFKL